MQERVWPSQTQSVPKGVSLLLRLSLKNNCTQWAVFFPQTSLSQSPPPPQLHFKQKIWTNSSCHKSKPAVGTQTKLDLLFEAWLAYLGGHCHYLAGFVALLLRDSSAAAPDVSEKVVTTTLLPERTHNSFPFPVQEWSCVHWRRQVATGSGAAWHTWDKHSSSDIPQIQVSSPSFQKCAHFI